MSLTKPGAWLSLEVDCLMLKIWLDHNARVVFEDGSKRIHTIAFHPDGKHVIDGTSYEIRRWRVADGQVVGKQTLSEVNVSAVSVSRDYKWVVCGTGEGVSVWDAEIREEAVRLEGEPEDVEAVDVAPDCTRFATGSWQAKASIWNIATGERLVGPLELGDSGVVVGIRFSPDGERIATARSEDPSIHIFNSRNGDQLISIENPMETMSPLTPIAWSMDGERLFATSEDSKSSPLMRPLDPNWPNGKFTTTTTHITCVLQLLQTTRSLLAPPVFSSHSGTL